MVESVKCYTPHARIDTYFVGGCLFIKTEIKLNLNLCTAGEFVKQYPCDRRTKKVAVATHG
jgi:hypothetical protein